MARLPRDRDNDIGPYSYRDFFRFLWKRIGSSRGKFWLASAMRLSADVAWLYPAYAVAAIVTTLSSPRTDHAVRTIVVIGIWWGLATIWRLMAMFLARIIGNQLAERTALETQLATTQHMFRLDVDWHERENAGNKLKRIDRGAQAISRVIRLWYNAAIEILVNIIGMTFIISRTTVGLGLSLVGFIVIFLVVSTMLMKRASVMETIVDQQEEDIHGLSFESINNIRSVKALGMTASLAERLRADVANLLRNVYRRVFLFQ